MAVMGVGPDAPMVTNERGGKQSVVPYEPFSFVNAELHVWNVMHAGAAKYGKGNWKDLSIEEILVHVITHAFAYQAGDRSDDHLGHMAARAMMALQLSLEEKRRKMAVDALFAS